MSRLLWWAALRSAPAAALAPPVRAPVARVASMHRSSAAPLRATATSSGRGRRVLVAGAGSMTGRSVARDLARASNIAVVRALASTDTLAATDDTGRALAADARPFDAAADADAIDALVIATDDPPPAEDVARLVAAAARVKSLPLKMQFLRTDRGACTQAATSNGAETVILYSRLGAGGAAALEVLGDDRAAWGRAEAACLENRGDAACVVCTGVVT